MNSRSAQALFTKSAALLLTGLVLACVAQAQDPEAPLSGDRPLVEINLHRFGYDTSGATRRLQKFVDFIDANHLAVAWLTLDNQSDEKIGPLRAKPAHLHVLVLDARTGENVGAHEWPTPSIPVRFLGGRDGKFLTCTGNILRSFSSSFEMVRQQNLDRDSACANQFPWNTRWGISPSRRSLLISYHSGQVYQNILLDTESFSVIASWAEAVRTENISDHWLLASCGQKREPCIRAINEPWRPFQFARTDKTNDFGFSTRFVSDDALVTGWAGKSVLTVDATQLFQITPSKGRSFEPGVISNGAERFAVVEDRQRGPASVALDMGYLSEDRARVYSVGERRAIFAVKIKGDSLWTPWELHRNQLALSSDGALLAILDGARLKIYRLPDKNSAH